jgi:hypothetical protein
MIAGSNERCVAEEKSYDTAANSIYRRGSRRRDSRNVCRHASESRLGPSLASRLVSAMVGLARSSLLLSAACVLWSTACRVCAATTGVLCAGSVNRFDNPIMRAHGSTATGDYRIMQRMIAPAAAALGIALALSACTDPYDPGQRALGGGLMGAGAGAAIGGLAGGGRGAAAGALIGGAVGAVGGAATTPQRPPPPGYYAPPPGYAAPPPSY